MIEHIISSILIAVVTVGGWFGIHQKSQPLGVFSDPFISIQLAENPSNGNCLTTDGTNNSWSSSCGSGGGGGGGGGTWSTTTSQVAGRLINYPNNDTDIVTIGSNSTTTAEYWFDQNTNTYILAGNGTTTGNFNVFRESKARNFTATSTTLASVFPYASSTAITVPNLFVTNLSNLTSNGFVKTGSSNGTLSVDTNSYLTGSGAGVTAVSVASANGFAGSSSGGATPALTLSTSVTGVLVGNGTAVAAGVDGTDFTLVNAVSCSNQFVRALTAAGVGTCATVGAADVALANLTATNGTLTFSGTYDGSTARTIGLNLGNANTWTALQTFANSSTTLASFNYASSTQYFGAGLQSCDPTTGKLLWTLGVFSCGTDQTGAGGGTFPFTTATNFATTTSATTTPLWLQGNRYSLFASSTSVFQYASTTHLTIAGSLYLQNTIKDGSNFNALDIGSRVLYDTAAVPVISWDGFSAGSGFSNFFFQSVTPGCLNTNGTSLTTTGVSCGPAGSDTQVQFNDGSSFGGDSGLVFNKTADRLTVTYASTTAISSGTICLTGDLPCRTTWPTGGGAAFPFTTETTYGTTTSATTTPLWLRGSKYSLFASSTSVLEYASTTAISSSAGSTFSTSGGNTGVGTTSPYTKFAVDNGTTTLNGDLKVGDIGPNAFTINTNGNVGVGTTTPWRKFSVDGTVSLKSLTQATGGANDALCITSNNEVVQETTGTCDTSSRRFKKNISGLNLNFINIINNIRTVIYSPKEGDSATYNNERIGFIAEEVAAVDPHLARYGTDDAPRTLDDRGMLAVLWGGVQDIARVVQGLVVKTLNHDDKIADMQSQIDVLKAEIETLKNK